MKRFSSRELDKMKHLSKTDWDEVDALPMTDKIDEEFDISSAEIIHPKQNMKLR